MFTLTSFKKEHAMASDRWRSEDKHWERTEGFRETLLLYFRPKKAKALQRLGEMLFAHALETGVLSTLTSDGYAKVRAGLTTITEVARALTT